MSALRDARLDRRWSQARAIGELQRHARALGVQLPAAASLKTEFSRWENGHRTPDAFYQRLFEMAYGRSAEDLGIGQGTPGEVVIGASWEESVVSASRMWQEDLARRDFLKTSTFAAALFAAHNLRALLSEASAAPSRAAGRRVVGGPQVTFIQDMTKQLGTFDNRYGGGHVRTAAVALPRGRGVAITHRGSILG